MAHNLQEDILFIICSNKVVTYVKYESKHNILLCMCALKLFIAQIKKTSCLLYDVK